MEIKPVAHNKALASLILGIISCASVVTGVGSVLGLILSIVGLVLANQAKKEGNTENIRTAGFVLNCIGVVITLITILIVIGTIALSLLAISIY